ncbi:hypothetical protein NMG60_11035479 [Bertholletia excelsa]
MAMLRTTLLRLAATAMLVGVAMAVSHTVGGPNGWDTAGDLQTWSSKQTFTAGDNLVFQYSANHDVMEVSKADYDSCTTTKPIKMYTGGNTVIALSSPGKRYFTCGTLGHCSQGMKVEIDTLAVASAPPPKANPSAASKPPTATPPTTSPSAPPTDSPVGTTDSPTAAPEKSPSISELPASAPALSPDVSSSSPFPSVSAPTPPSSATKVSVFLGSVLGLGFGMVMLLGA